MSDENRTILGSRASGGGDESPNVLEQEFGEVLGSFLITGCAL